METVEQYILQFHMILEKKCLFYIDFIIKYKDGRIGLFDTKTGITLRDAKNKSDGLLAYFKDQNKNRKSCLEA